VGTAVRPWRRGPSKVAMKSYCSTISPDPVAEGFLPIHYLRRYFIVTPPDMTLSLTDMCC
jgi:hypothetical protein